ncbi:MAG: DUF1887 family protein, partial [Lachnospiraceae bacterium]|nr:DUF1887 family protein [Lachnospiraceae bacterium]
MKTLIELYDEAPIENVLATEMFRPKEMVLLCPPEIEPERVLKASLEKYFRYRGCPVKLTVIPVSLIDAAKVAKRLKEVLKTRKDCAIDISGGTDAALFAAGKVCGDTPVFTYSRKRNVFYEISNAPFAKSLPCSVRLDARSCFLMAGGSLLPGREDNAILKQKLSRIDSLFDIFFKYKRIWGRQIEYIQKISSSEPGALSAGGPCQIKSDRGEITVSKDLLNDLSKAGLIRDLAITEADDAEAEKLSFSFADETERFWLRDIGAVLELQVYKTAIRSQLFNDVVLSAVVNWEGGDSQRNAVTNEIDVMAVAGINPLFISCKTGDIRTEALNELAILRDRFGGKNARAMIVTSKSLSGHSPVRKRSTELNIEVVDAEELKTDALIKRLS